MKQLLLISACCFPLALLAQEGKEAKSVSLAHAKQTGWRLVSAIAEAVGNEKEYDPQRFPGNAAWFAEFRQATAGCSMKKPEEQWPVLDADRLVTRNPLYWQMHFEVAPADPMLAVLQAGLLQMSGSTERSSDLLVIVAQGVGHTEDLRGLLYAAIQENNATLTQPDRLMKEGIALHDRGDFKGALAKYDAGLKLHPRYGALWYEKGYTLRTQAWRAAGITDQKAKVLLEQNKLPENLREVTEAFAAARRHNPFQYMAYQGEDKQILAGFTALTQKGLPAWKKMQQGFGKTVSDETLRDLAEALQTAGAHDLAIEARQVLVARRGNYVPEDYPFFAKSLKALVRGPILEQILVKLRGKSMEVRQFAKLQSPKKNQTDRKKPVPPTEDFKPIAADLETLFLLIPAPQLKQRVGEIEPFADYAKSVWRKVDQIVSTANPNELKANGLLVTVGMKSKTNIRVWCEAVEGEIPVELMRKIEKQVAQLEAIELQQVPMAFALQIKLFHRQVKQFPQIPSAWSWEAKKHGIAVVIPPDELFQKIWEK